ncbi:hypothetical protein AMJ83_03875 [candidate division WOR_3 bacterium SM23_42]|uniref:Secretion system C-terminal sorting domain-containing protein n=1 Tax=candidate division WOR_3 bacterium SM23_42 TaxID=1703779 RepID=A0A0S8FTS7_UNCW3|nr:MAG: hypothetical protein AMJ83_03875 [candidate division WOR_3 bacterium SM23_42]
MRRSIVIFTILFGVGFSLPYWTEQDFINADSIPRLDPIMQYDVGPLRTEWQMWSYVHELCQTAAFIASMQVSDTLDPEFGGLIEGEDAMGVVETDNTQEAIWVWCRYYQITGDTTYFVNLRRAWIYVLNHPAWLEEGTDSDYYRVWNCGLAFFAESKYRTITGDSSYMPYADTCSQYMLGHPLPFTGVPQTYARLHPKVTSLAAGMLYQYGKEMNNQTWKDTALAYGDRVRVWVEANPNVNINDEVWAMSGGTAVWGLCRSIFDADSSFGVTWLSTYLPYMKYYQPAGTWNNSWNIWYANAYNFSARITQNGTYVDYHHSITDSLLIQDYDNDGGVPPTRGWNENQDHSWISSYMVFMGFEGLMDSVRTYDAGVNGIYATGPRPFLLIGDTVQVAVQAANYGFAALSDVYLEVTDAFSGDTTVDLAIGVEDTFALANIFIPSDTGYLSFTGYSLYAGDERPANDTFTTSIYVRPLRFVSGTVIDTVNSTGIDAKLYFQFLDDSGASYFDSTETNPSTGIFSVYLIDSLYRAYIYTDIPYPDSVAEYIYVTPDSVSDFDFAFGPADLLVINRDNEARYADYYAAPLDSLNITCKVWAPQNQGLFPMSRIDEFNYNTIIWYTGQAVVDNVTSSEQESLMVFLDSGGKLLITGQNVGEEISGTQFYSDYLHAVLVSDSINSLKCFPDTLDALGQDIGKLYTVGITGAQNQYSRDVIAADTLAHEFLYYDSLLTDCAGIWYEDAISGCQIVYCAFGVEAVHKPIPWLGYMTRTQLLERFLSWFGVVAVAEGSVERPYSLFSVFPNPSHRQVYITMGSSLVGKTGSLRVYDITGRLVKTIFDEQSLDGLSWYLDDSHGRRLSSGVYFLSLETADINDMRKVIIVD